MNEAIQAKAKEIMTVLDRTRFSMEHQPALFQGLMDLAEVCGAKLQKPRAYGNGEVSIITVTNDHGGCTPYGEEFSALLRLIPCRTGERQYGYNAIMIPCNGWCYVNYWSVEHLIQFAAEGRTPTR